jgi:hypothetical protein
MACGAEGLGGLRTRLGWLLGRCCTPEGVAWPRRATWMLRHRWSSPPKWAADCRNASGAETSSWPASFSGSSYAKQEWRGRRRAGSAATPSSTRARNANALRRALGYGNLGSVRARDPEQIHRQLEARRLGANAIHYRNTCHIMLSLAQLARLLVSAGSDPIRLPQPALVVRDVRRSNRLARWLPENFALDRRSRWQTCWGIRSPVDVNHVLGVTPSVRERLLGVRCRFEPVQHGDVHADAAFGELV